MPLKNPGFFLPDTPPLVSPRQDFARRGLIFFGGKKMIRFALGTYHRPPVSRLCLRGFRSNERHDRSPPRAY
ncbi:MAG: hypothetical protein D6714_00775 [Bacteroidetes bacterium]|nr:MAG: hypothetical protein D6714_00775 [Bacteroidota bacterium]